ncbi:MAG TPA: polyhydroxyalkanoate synthesis regulator DNA-binding domain-containing protein [Deltaproteobacteria bacterium]|nr:polyhydroxyalkanoate synthesis regulator DNA-binding domain-containing protein [Deltaproteobacteria bacterium]HOM28037.1 polyhydroxyalkanoate synthesis regulator DNA-binding domain-containing protein [Deltaproteobacteria bacterium]
MPETVTLKKYASRRLYNPKNSSYVTLAQVADMIRSGVDVVVQDAKTGEDVTAFILTQVILEEARNKKALLPPPLLHLIIRSDGSALKEFFDKHLTNAISSYLALKDAFDEQFNKWLAMGMNYSDLAREAFKTMPMFGPFFGPPGTPGPTAEDRGEEKRRKR